MTFYFVVDSCDGIGTRFPASRHSKRALFTVFCAVMTVSQW